MSDFGQISPWHGLCCNVGMTNYITNRIDHMFKDFPLFDYEINGADLVSKYEFNCAGIKKNNIKISVNGNLLQVAAEQEDRKYRKGVRLPNGTDIDSITASYNDGLLVINIDKKKEQKIIDIK